MILPTVYEKLRIMFELIAGLIEVLAGFVVGYFKEKYKVDYSIIVSVLFFN